MNKKEVLEQGIAELSKEPNHIYEILDSLTLQINDFNKDKIIEILTSLDLYAFDYLNKEEFYAEISGFPKIELLKSDHNYYKATFYRIRYHFIYFDVETREYKNILQFGIHLAHNLREWLDFHLNTLDEELIGYLKSEVQKL